MNKYTGESSLEIAGKTHKLCYTWRAIAKIKSKLTLEQQNKALEKEDINSLAILVACGLGEDWTPEMVLEASPPVFAAAQAANAALLISYFGINGIPEEEQSVKKKIATQLKKLYQLLLG